MQAFDPLAAVYDALIDWPKRLAREAPFYRRWFAAAAARRVLDAACGTGRHAALFHEWGLDVEGADASPAMIAQCRRLHGETDRLHWVVRSFDQPHAAPAAFDAAICVGNSLGLVADRAAVARAVAALLGAVRPGGLLLLHVLNLWRIPEGPVTWQRFRRVTLDGTEHTLVKGVHRVADRGYVELVDLTPAADGGLQSRIDAPSFLGLEAEFLADAAQTHGGRDIRFFGDYDELPYKRDQSPDLIVVVRK